MPGLGALWDSLVDCICRPPRDQYLYPDDLIGGRRGLFRVGRFPGIREDLTLVNRRGLRLACSHFFPRHVRGRDGRLPCVIYCHCNSGSRRDAEEAICVLLPHGVSVFTLDFAGSGLSEGQWVTLGCEEVEDVAAAVEYLRSSGRVSTLGLWGRSMGAVTALLYSQRDPSIAGMVLDSPFSRLTDLMMEIVAEQRLPVPRPLAKLALAAMRRSVSKRAGFDITKVSPVDAVSQSFIPALFGHATGDTFIRISHAEALHAAYAGDKNLIRFEGDHNSRRPEFFYNSVSIFWHNTLQLEILVEPGLGPLIDGPLAAAAVAGGGGTPGRPGGVGIPLAPPMPRHRTTPAAAAAAGGRPGSPGGSDRSSDADGPTAAPPPPPPSGASVASGAMAVAGRSASGGLGGEGGEDVTELGASRRSAPWEPRMWEWDLDRAERERQRFRRMAGGLPGPSEEARSAAAAAAAAASGAGGAAALGADRGALDLAALLAAAGEPSALDGLGLTGGGGGGGGGGLAGRLLLAPGSEEEEEAQLMAALQLSLLEAAVTGPPAGAVAVGVGGGGGASAAGGATPAAPPPAQQPQPQRSSGLRSGEQAPGGGGAGGGPGPLQATGRSGSPSLPHSGEGAAAPSAAAVARRSLSQEEARPPARLPPLPLGALSGPHCELQQQQQQQQQQGQQQQWRSQQQQPPISAPASGRPGPGSPWPLPSLMPTPAPAPSASAAGSPGPVPPGPAVLSANAGSRAASPAHGGPLSPTAASAAAPTASAAPAGLPTRRHAVNGPSLYDMYSEDELLALAVQLSLQEAGPTRGSPAGTGPASETVGGGGGVPARQSSAVGAGGGAGAGDGTGRIG